MAKYLPRILSQRYEAIVKDNTTNASYHKSITGQKQPITWVTALRTPDFQSVIDILDAFHDLVPFAQNKKHEKDSLRSVTSSKIAG